MRLHIGAGAPDRRHAWQWDAFSTLNLHRMPGFGGARHGSRPGTAKAEPTMGSLRQLEEGQDEGRGFPKTPSLYPRQTQPRLRTRSPGWLTSGPRRASDHQATLARAMGRETLYHVPAMRLMISQWLTGSRAECEKSLQLSAVLGRRARTRVEEGETAPQRLMANGPCSELRSRDVAACTVESPDSSSRSLGVGSKGWGRWNFEKVKQEPSPPGIGYGEPRLSLSSPVVLGSQGTLRYCFDPC